MVAARKAKVISKAKVGKKLPKTRKEKRAGIVFPVARIHRHLKRGLYSKRVSLGASVYMASVLEYLTAEVVELSGNSARDNKLKRIRPRDILFAVENDVEIHSFLSKIIIPDAGVIPFVHPALKSTGKGRYEYFKTHTSATAFVGKQDKIEEPTIPVSAKSYSYRGERLSQKQQLSDEELQMDEDAENPLDSLSKLPIERDFVVRKSQELEDEIKEEERSIQEKRKVLMKLREKRENKETQEKDVKSQADTETTAEFTIGEIDVGKEIEEVSAG